MSYTCPRCGRTSHNENDEKHGYCANCNDYTGDTVPVTNLHGYTCAYCTGGGDLGDRPRWDTREGFELHMQRIHPGLPFEIDPIITALARIEQIARPFDISMGGQETFHPLAPPRVKQIRDIAREALNRDA